MSSFNVLESLQSKEGESTGKVIDFAHRSYATASELASTSAAKIKEEFTPNQNAVLWKGLLAGLAAGVAATAVMTAFQLGWSKAQTAIEKATSDEASQSEEQDSDRDESSTVKVAEWFTRRTLDHPLQSSAKEPASYAVHFAFGALMGGLYGMSSEYLPVAKLGHGLLHGIGLWVGADALALPALRLSKPVTERSGGELAYEILAHAVYGVTSESVRKIVRDRF